MAWDKKHAEAMKAQYKDWRDYRNDPQSITLKRGNTEIFMRMHGAGGHVDLIITQGDTRIEAKLNWSEIGDLFSVVSNLSSYMTEWNS